MSHAPRGQHGDHGILTWAQRCETHPDHDGVVTEDMIRARMQEEIDALRAALAEAAMQRLTDVQEMDHFRDATKMVATINKMETVEPVAWRCWERRGNDIYIWISPEKAGDGHEPLYAIPPQHHLLIAPENAS